MIMQEVEALRAKGWQFQFASDGDAWWCKAVALGLAYGEGSGETLEKAAEDALKTTRAMEDAPKVLIKEYGLRIEKLAKEIFGEAAYQGIEPVESPEEFEPVRIAMSLLQMVAPGAYMDLEVKFIRRMMAEFPKEFTRSFIIEVDYPEEKVKEA
jgi:hypothetical protein